MKIYLKILSILFVGTLMLFSSCSHNYHFATENDILTFSIIVNGEQKAGVKTVLGDTIKGGSKNSFFQYSSVKFF